MSAHFPDPPKQTPTLNVRNPSRQLIAPNEIPGSWVTNTCAEKDCTALLGHWSKNGSWKYPGAKCDKHNKRTRK